MKEVFEVAWADFYERVVKNHLPKQVSTVAELYGNHMIVYAPPLSFPMMDVSASAALMALPPGGVPVYPSGGSWA